MSANRRYLVLPLIALVLLTTFPQPNALRAQSEPDSASSIPLAAPGQYKAYLPLIQTDSKTISTTISPEGGELTTPDKRVRLVVPAGAVTEPVIVSFTWNGNTPQQSGMSSLSSAFDFTARTAQGQLITQFAKPLQIEMQLGSRGSQGSMLYYYDTTQQRWVALPSSFDAQSGVLTGTTDHFTTFMVASEMCGVGEGDGVPPEVTEAFKKAHTRNDPSRMGAPTNCVHLWSEDQGIMNWVQDFPDTPNWGKSVILWNPAQSKWNRDKAYVVRGAILEHYRSLNDSGKNGPGTWLGASISDETIAPADLVSLDTSPSGEHPWSYDGEAISYFERGYISTRRGEGRFTASTYPPALCNVFVAVTDTSDGQPTLHVSAYVDRAPGYDTADENSDPIEPYITIVFPSGRKSWIKLLQPSKNSLAATIGPDDFAEPLVLNENVHFYLDVRNNKWAKDGGQPILRTFPKDVAQNPGWFQVPNWTEPKDVLRPLQLTPGVVEMPPDDNPQCPGGDGPGHEKPFIYVALGDSFQSGEGVNSSIQDSSASEFPNIYRRGTYIDIKENGIEQNGNGCHRSYNNYPALLEPMLKVGKRVELIDVTCSGATIAPRDTSWKSIIGTSPDANNPDSQLAEAMRRLKELGYGPADVDLVTVGMGGNDAHFVDMIKACLAPTIILALLEKYPDTPNELRLLGNHGAPLLEKLRVSGCKEVDARVFQTEQLISQLKALEASGQQKLLQTFTSAQIMQLNYPDILPKQIKSSWCSGIRSEDLPYARGKLVDMNKAIANALSDNAQTDPRLTLMDVSDVLGSDPLCGSAHVNGIDEKPFESEIHRLVYDDPTARQHLDALNKAYRAFMQCKRDAFVFRQGACDTRAAEAQMNQAFNELGAYLESQLKCAILPNLVAPPESRLGPCTGTQSTGQTEAQFYERAQGLFHPKASGQRLLADRVNDVFQNPALMTSPMRLADLAPQTTAADLINGTLISNAPVVGGIGTRLDVQIGSFAPNTPVAIWLFAPPTDLGTVVSDGSGVVRTTITLPEVNAGIQTLEFRGSTVAGIGIHKDVRVSYPGRPMGEDSYGMYRPGFIPTPDDGTQPDQVDIIYDGDHFVTVGADIEGGVFTRLPLYDYLNRPDPLPVTFRSQRTATTITAQIDYIPSIAGFWAIGTQPDALTITGHNTTVNGRVHSNTGIIVHGSQTALTAGIEYGIEMTVTGNDHNLPHVRKVAPGGLPIVRKLADYRPGGVRALRAGDNYHVIPNADCRAGTWNVRASDIPSGIVYVPCAVSISGSNATIAALLVAEGPIHVRGNDITVDPGIPGTLALLTAAAGSDAIRINGSDVQIRGTTQALNGEVRIAGADGLYRCGVIAQTITVNGTRNTVQVDERCRVSPEQSR